ncbi:MAG: hypothetical protein GY947_08040 [Rhodobacteraceae bacterium]|nr:hypothetical protein [Paracoccaceae bacterium]
MADLPASDQSNMGCVSVAKNGTVAALWKKNGDFLNFILYRALDFCEIVAIVRRA